MDISSITIRVSTKQSQGTKEGVLNPAKTWLYDNLKKTLHWYCFMMFYGNGINDNLLSIIVLPVVPHKAWRKFQK